MNPIRKWAVVVGILASGTFAWGVEFSSPGPVGKQGKFSVAAGYANGRDKMTGDGNPSIDRNQIYMEGTYRHPGREEVR
jgi:hypothetical protein